jgi:DinB superfamily
MDGKTVLIDQLTNHSKAFLKGLEGVPDEIFNLEPPAGGHSVAWHALHIADWQRILVSPELAGVDPGARFAYLGWEDRDWSKAVLGTSPAAHAEPKARILEYVRTELERGPRDILNATDAQLQANVTTPMGERAVWTMLTGQVRHIAYHWGQAMMTSSQLSRASL